MPTLTERLIEKLGLQKPPDPDPDELLAQQLADIILGKTTTEPDKDKPNTDPPKPTTAPSVEDLAKSLADLRTQGHGQRLDELSSTVKSLSEERDQLKAAVRLGDSQATVKRLSEGPGWVLPIPAQERLLAVLLRADGETRKAVVELFEGIHGTGLVELKERGVAPAELDLTRFADDPYAMFGSKVERLVAEKKLSETDAMRQVARDDPNLYAAYRKAADLKRAG